VRLKLGKILALLAFLTVPVVLAHTPLKLGEENESLETAYEIPDPTSHGPSTRSSTREARPSTTRCSWGPETGCW